jgi:hypothetical protein
MNRLWNITRGPRIGEDIVAWCEEQCTEAVVEHVTEGRLELTNRNEDPRDKTIIDWTVRFLLNDASIDDPSRHKKLDQLIDAEIDYHLSYKDPRRFHDAAGAEMRSLRDTLRAAADRIDRLLKQNVVPEDP